MQWTIPFIPLGHERFGKGFESGSALAGIAEWTILKSFDDYWPNFKRVGISGNCLLGHRFEITQ